jgi:hypothetical protein
MFSVRFPNAQMVSEWECFNTINMRNVKANVKVSPWSGAVGAKAELEMAWFRVKGIPYYKRSIPTLAYVGSLIGAAVEIDEASLHMIDYVRIRIAAKEVAKVPEVVDGAIVPFLYDFYFERVVERAHTRKDESVKIGVDKGVDVHPSPKKPRNDNASTAAPTMQIVPLSSGTGVETKKYSQGAEKQHKISIEFHSAPSRMAMWEDLVTSEHGGKKFRFQQLETANLALFNSEEDRVQGLSGTDIFESEEDPMSEEVQQDQLKQKKGLWGVSFWRPIRRVLVLNL